MNRTIAGFLAAMLILPVTPVFGRDAPVDWANLSAYREADQQLLAGPRDRRRVVFIGDSITESWDRDRATLFTNPSLINRGISGQTSGQMLLRFRQDVIALRPRVVVILAGTNDIAGNNGPASDEEIEGNIASMVELAKANRIRVILATLVPAAEYGWAPAVRPAPRIAAINAWIRAFAKDKRILLCDFYPAMATPDGALRSDLGDDGVHPNAAGYRVMEATLRPILERAVT